MTGGFLFGLWPGLLLSVTGATVGATVIFLIARPAVGDTSVKRETTSQGTMCHCERSEAIPIVAGIASRIKSGTATLLAMTHDSRSNDGGD
jgi:uncharacterized membrane protein YdjX (TVP38/TMEM64 family)